MRKLTRRDFSKGLARAGLAAAASGARVLGSNDRVRLSFIGLGNRGDQVLDAFLTRPDAEFIRSGGLGEVAAVRAFHIGNEWPNGIGRPRDEQPPEGFDWNAWLGPAPWVPYNKNRTFYRFRWFYDYSGGQVTNFGVHYIDMIQWALGWDAPLAVAAMGSKLAVRDNREIPDTLEVRWTYPNGTLVTFSQFDANGARAAARQGQIEFRGTKGTLNVDWNGYEVIPEEVTE